MSFEENPERVTFLSGWRGDFVPRPYIPPPPPTNLADEIPLETIACRFCGKPVIQRPKRKQRIYCSEYHARRYYEKMKTVEKPNG